MRPLDEGQSRMMREPAYPLYEGPHKVRRGVFETRIDILKAIRYGPKRILRISMEANLSYRGLRGNLDFMAEKGLVGISEVPPRTRDARKYGVMVFLTRKGLIVLDRVEAAYGELLDLQSHEDDLARIEAQAREQPIKRATPA